MKLESFDEFNEKKKNWIKDAIKKPGSLKRSLGKKKDDKLNLSEIESELKKLVAKDKDKKKPGTQLGKKDSKKKKRLELAKTLSKMNESISDNELRIKIGEWIDYIDDIEMQENKSIPIIHDMKLVFDNLNDFNINKLVYWIDYLDDVEYDFNIQLSIINDMKDVLNKLNNH